MPGNIFTRMFGCLGNENQVQANEPRYVPLANAAPPARATAIATFLPGRFYTPAELQEIARINPPRAETKTEFLNTMVAALNRPGTTKHEKAGLCKHLARMMGENDALLFKGGQRQANYFASYSIDLNFQQLDTGYNIHIEQDVREMLTLWTNTLCPAQTQFNLDGIVYSRDEINTMLRNPTLVQRQNTQQLAALAPQLDDALRNAGSQNVHHNAVRNNGARVMEIMRQKHGQTTEMTGPEITRFLDPAIQKSRYRHSIRAGLNHCLQATGFDPNSPNSMTPKRLLGNVCQYIQATTDPVMRSNLTEALMIRLDEIHVEHPCVVGVSQRLLDVPNGIDPAMNFSGRAIQVAQEVTTIAGKTYNQFSELVDEGIQALKEIEKKEDIESNDKIITDIGQNMFKSRLKNDLNRLGGIAESEIAPHRERLKTGFTSPS